MKIERENLAGSKVKLKIEIQPEELVKYYRESYQKIADGVDVAGFRPGKAPFKIVVAKVGYNRLLNEGINTAVTESYGQALSEEKISPISQPSLSLSKTPQFSLDQNEIKDNLTYQAEFYIMPKVELLDISKVKVKLPKKGTAKQDDVEKIINHLLKQKATFLEINRPIKKGDRVEINFEGSVKGVKKDKICSKNFPLLLGESNLVPGFEDNIIGLSKGDKKEFKLAFPKDYFDKEIAGEKVDFKIEVIDAKEVILPPFNDEFAKNFNQPSAKKLRQAVKDSLEAEIAQAFSNKVDMIVIDHVLPKLRVNVPEVLISNEIDRMVEDLKKRVESQNLTFEKYLGSLKKSESDLRKDMSHQAEKNIRIGFLLGKVIKEKKWDPSNKETTKKAIEYLVKTVTK